MQQRRVKRQEPTAPYVRPKATPVQPVFLRVLSEALQLESQCWPLALVPSFPVPLPPPAARGFKLRNSEIGAHHSLKSKYRLLPPPLAKCPSSFLRRPSTPPTSTSWLERTASCLNCPTLPALKVSQSSMPLAQAPSSRLVNASFPPALVSALGAAAPSQKRALSCLSLQTFQLNTRPCCP
jgi:hypothetical protein